MRTVVELACGTGSLTRILAERGYEMTAVDLSADMLSFAAQKCQDLPVLFLCQDMSRLTLLEQADAVVCCLDSVNYVTCPADLRRAFQRVHLFLMPGGVFLFDVNTPEKLRNLDGQMFMDETDDTYCVWRAEYSARRRICTYGMDLFFREGALWRREEEVHEEYAYEPRELTDYLHAAGFRDVKQYGELKLRPPKPGEGRIFFAARKDL